MQPSVKHERSSDLQSIVIVQSPKLVEGSKAKEKTGFYADNLAFEHEELITRSAGDVYHVLSRPTKTTENGFVPVISTPIDKWLLWRAVISGCLLAATIFFFYLWIHVRYISPMIIEVLKASPPELPSAPASRVMFLSEVKEYVDTSILKPITSFKSSSWLVDYDLPEGFPVLKLNAKEISEMNEIVCPTQKFALALHIESNSELAENWLQACGHNIEYFRVNGDPSPDDIDRLIKYLNITHYLPLKAVLNIEKGENILENEAFQKTRQSDEIIRNVAVSGYVTPQTIEELIEAVPYAEELTIKGDAICNSLKRSRQSSKQECQVSWHVLQKLRIVETGDCLGMFDLIYSCWDMPSIETLQIRKSSINDPNANYIKGILDKYRVMHVDFADNVCFGDSMLDYPFMCQPSN